MTRGGWCCLDQSHAYRRPRRPRLRESNMQQIMLSQRRSPPAGDGKMFTLYLRRQPGFDRHAAPVFRADAKVCRLFGLSHYLLHTIRPSAACAACAACGASTSAVSCAASATLPRSACPLGKLQAGTPYPGVFVVKDIESQQTNVGNFFLIESNCRARRQSVALRTNGCLGCASHQR